MTKVALIVKTPKHVDTADPSQFRYVIAGPLAVSIQLCISEGVLVRSLKQVSAEISTFLLLAQCGKKTASIQGVSISVAEGRANLNAKGNIDYQPVKLKSKE